MGELTHDPHTEYVGCWVAWTGRIMRRGGFVSTPARMVEALEMLCGKPGEDWGEQCPECRKFTGQKWEIMMNGGKVRERLECPVCFGVSIRQPKFEDDPALAAAPEASA